MEDQDPEVIIDQLGISKRLGTSIFDELSHRASEANELVHRLDTEEEIREHVPDAHFNKVHDLNFQNMKSVDTHYSVQLDDQKKKKYKFSPIKRTPEVVEITKKIRRLKLRSSSTLSNGGSPEKRSHSNATVESKTNLAPLKTPSFLQPTINSMNRARETTTYITSGQKSKIEPLRRPPMPSFNTDNSTFNMSKSRIRRDNISIRSEPFNQVRTEHTRPSINHNHRIMQRSVSTQFRQSSDNNMLRKNGISGTTSEQRSISDGSSNVFERLYRQSTMSRSNSMAFDQTHKRTLSKSKTMGSLSKIANGTDNKNEKPKPWR
ncbi:She1p RNJ42_03129 [Nakaseomyces bracarensis]|uniref:She1p n=1 Tax=Nakaseomyces bracarensis TaxID=273131 RepID=UPI0038712B48